MILFVGNDIIPQHFLFGKDELFKMLYNSACCEYTLYKLISFLHQKDTGIPYPRELYEQKITKVYGDKAPRLIHTLEQFKQNIFSL